MPSPKAPTSPYPTIRWTATSEPSYRTSSSLSTTEARAQSCSYTEVAHYATHTSQTIPVTAHDVQKWFKQIQQVLTKLSLSLDSNNTHLILNWRGQALRTDDYRTFHRLYRRFKDVRPLPVISNPELSEKDWDTHMRRRWLRQLMLWLALRFRVLPAFMSVRMMGTDSAHPFTCGGCADIYKGRCRGMAVALKRFRRTAVQDTGRTEQTIRQSYQECLVWWNLVHPFILPLIGVDAEAFLKTQTLSPITPWMEKGNILQAVADIIEEGTPIGLVLDKVHLWINQVMLGLGYIHSEGVIHGDLRGVNILIDDHGSALIADFGLCAFSDIEGQHFATVNGGADAWLPPEMFDPAADERQTAPGDIYSLGCVILELYTGKRPWHEWNQRKISSLVLKGERPSRPMFRGESRMASRVWRIVQKCWAHLPAERPTADVVLQKFEKAIQTDRIKQSHLLTLRYFITGEISSQRLIKTMAANPVQIERMISSLLTGDPEHMAYFYNVFFAQERSLDLPSDVPALRRRLELAQQELLPSHRKPIPGMKRYHLVQLYPNAYTPPNSARMQVYYYGESLEFVSEMRDAISEAMYRA